LLIYIIFVKAAFYADLFVDEISKNASKKVLVKKPMKKYVITK